MFTAIKDIAYYLPERILSNEDLTKIFEEWEPTKIFSKLGIRNRHIAGDDETAVDLAERASLELFYKNPGLKDKVDFIILCTQSPDYYLPTSACILQHRLGLSTSCGAFDFNLGCSGFIYGLAVSKGLVEAGIAENILLVMAETYSKHINNLDKSTRTIFGDGAGAAWIGKSNDGSCIKEFVLGTDGSGAKNLIVKTGGLRASKSIYTAEEQVDEQGNIRSEDNLYMNGAEVFNFTLKSVPPLVEKLLIKNNLSHKDMDYYVFHQANKYMLEHLRKKIKIPEEKFYLNMEETGNTVSATIPIALCEAAIEGKIKKGDKIMLVGFGVGYSWGGCVIEW